MRIRLESDFDGSKEQLECSSWNSHWLLMDQLWLDWLLNTGHRWSALKHGLGFNHVNMTVVSLLYFFSLSDIRSRHVTALCSSIDTVQILSDVSLLYGTLWSSSFCHDFQGCSARFWPGDQCSMTVMSCHQSTADQCYCAPFFSQGHTVQ